MSVEGKTATQSGFSKFVHQAQQSLGPLLALIILCVVASIASQFFLSPRNILNVLRQSSINAIIAAGMTLTILTGGIDLSVGSVVALSSTTLGLLMIHRDYQRQGYGREIAEEFLHWAESRNWPEIRIGVLEENTGALAFWRSLGFEQYDVKEKRMPGGIKNVICMRYPIPRSNRGSDLLEK